MKITQESSLGSHANGRKNYIGEDDVIDMIKVLVL